MHGKKDLAGMIRIMGWQDPPGLSARPSVITTSTKVGCWRVTAREGRRGGSIDKRVTESTLEKEEESPR